MKYYKLMLVLIASLSAFTVHSKGCTYDTQCKGERICQGGICVAPEPNSNPNSNSSSEQEKIRQKALCIHNCSPEGDQCRKSCDGNRSCIIDCYNKEGSCTDNC